MVQTNNKVKFDDYVDTYEKEIQSSIDFIGQDHDFFVSVKADIIKDLAKRHFDEPHKLKVLDIGCGIGLIDHYLKNYFENIFGIDLEEGVIEKAQKYNPSVNYIVYDGKTLPFEDNSTDVVFTVNVMHHIPPELQEHCLAEIYRVTQKGGLVIVMEHNPLNPLTRKAVSNCEFDRDAILIHKNEMKNLFSSCGLKDIRSSYILFFPFSKSFFRKIEKLIEWVPLGAQYYVYGWKLD